MRQPRKPVKHFKRKVHFGLGEMWSWQRLGNLTGVRVRSPAGVTTFIERDNFVGEIRYNWGDLGDEDLPHWCCEECCPTWYGGFTPSAIKTYIRVVLKNGGIWRKP